jgi:hypothetical protein
MEKITHFIGGHRIDTTSERYADVFNRKPPAKSP